MMIISDDSSERPSLQTMLGGPVFQILTFATFICLAAGAIGTLWLLASLIFGNYGDFASVSKEAQAAALSNISLAQMLMTWGFGIGSVLCAIVYFGEEALGYALLAGALLIGFGIPVGFQQFGGEAYAATKSVALGNVYNSFSSGVRLPALVGGLFICYDVVQRLIRTVRERPTVKVEKMTYGTGAKQENAGRPARTSPLGKCWEGPFCRDFIRPHCPIFLKRQACWQQKRGCYCEEDIVSQAAAKVTGQTLPMAGGNSRFANMATAPRNDMNAVPDPMASGFQMIGVGAPAPAGMGGMNPSPPTHSQAPRRIELSAGQKRERCRNCVIYNEHQREKYQLLLPIVLIGTVILCGYVAMQFQTNAAAVVDGIEMVINRFSFLPGNDKVKVGNSSSAVAWIFIGAATIVIVSKMLQFLEWCVFKIKI
ncbi:MAG: hypothetical protein H8F28_16590 [Fibrella sp.]|nr:hypothetical protein [Armatimonadota bacterium]